MNYLETIASIAKPNKYTAAYIRICERALLRHVWDDTKHKDTNRARARKVLGYVEIHHIVPKSFGLGGEHDTKNFVVLTAREHYIIHLLATKMFEGPFHTKMLKGFTYMMCDHTGKRHSSKAFAHLRATIPGPTKGMQINKRAKPITLNGMEFRTQQEAAKHFDVCTAAVQKWARKGLTEVTPKTAKNHGYSVVVEGVTYTSAAEAARALNIPVRTFSRHVKQGKYGSAQTVSV